MKGLIDHQAVMPGKAAAILAGSQSESHQSRAVCGAEDAVWHTKAHLLPA